jgi:hypothetical protein
VRLEEARKQKNRALHVVCDGFDHLREAPPYLDRAGGFGGFWAPLAEWGTVVKLVHRRE